MKTLSLLLILLCFSINFAQQSIVYDDLSMESEILEMDRKYAVYLPPDYNTSVRSYPVLYLLHGKGDDQTGWVQFGEVKYIADKLINSGKATPMIIVMPDANTGKRGYRNDMKGEWRYEDFFFEEFIPFIEKTYRIKSEKQYRAIAGLSMGGGGTFLYALHRPDLFAAACPLSASAKIFNEEEINNLIERYGDQGIEKEVLNKWIQIYDIHFLINNISPEKISSVKWYIDCGDDDILYEGNSLVHIEMKKREIPHEYRVRDGIHEWSYWRESLHDVLNFITVKFHRGSN